MPGFYSPGTYDLAGFAVGIVKQSRLLPRKVAKGDVLVGLASSGPHSNGYSLIRKVFTSRQLKNSVGKQVMKPTVIYVKPILKLLDKIPVSALVHITGGGFLENIPRVLPRGLTARIDSESWPIPELFQKVQVKGKIKKQEMFRTFNMGIGMIAVVREKDAKRSQALLKGQGLKSWIIGEIVKGRKVEIV